MTQVLNLYAIALREKYSKSNNLCIGEFDENPCNTQNLTINTIVIHKLK